MVPVTESAEALEISMQHMEKKATRQREDQEEADQAAIVALEKEVKRLRDCMFKIIRRLTQAQSEHGHRSDFLTHDPTARPYQGSSFFDTISKLRERAERNAETLTFQSVNQPMWSFQQLSIDDDSTSSKQDSYKVFPITASTNGRFSVFEDWSGRGSSHVDFVENEKPPLEEGRFLGQGVMGPVYETVIRGHAFAWKRRFCRQQIGDAERKEIDILKKLSHHHVIQLVGTYTWRQFLGLLLYPVAVCDLHTFLEDVESYASTGQLNGEQSSRFAGLGFPNVRNFGTTSLAHWYLWPQVGCIVSAVDYLHSREIRHKDLKPSNILLSKQGLWLADFGSATDFSQLSVSQTENGERGSPKYFAPEVASYQRSGRAADIFSLGCILLEICIHIVGNIETLRSYRQARDRSFQANLDNVDHWFGLLKDSTSACSSHVVLEIRQMLSVSPTSRPTATELLKNLAHIDKFNVGDGSIFGRCCQPFILTREEHEERVSLVTTEFQQTMKLLKNKHEDEKHSLRSQNIMLRQVKAKLEEEIYKLKNDTVSPTSAAELIHKPSSEREEVVRSQ